MASRNSVKIYIADSFYHVYNRGVEKRTIFQDKQDYSVFLSYLKTYLISKDKNLLNTILTSEKSLAKEKDKALKLLKLKNYSSDIKLICYALLPNHFHLLLKQENCLMDKFMNSLGTRYAMYFNKKYKRKGVLFQDVYKAVRVETDEQLLQLSRYIHHNPIKAQNLKLSKSNLVNTVYPSSLPEFLRLRSTKWIHASYVLDYFSKSNKNLSYENFLCEEEDLDLIHNLILDLEE